MQSPDNLLTIRKLFRFSLNIMDFHDELCDQKKAPIAKRVLLSTLHGVCAFQKFMVAEKMMEKKENITQASAHFKNVIYWLEQCEKSGYLFNEKLIVDAHELFEFCRSQNLANVV
jgi:hypothetical protein